MTLEWKSIVLRVARRGHHLCVNRSCLSINVCMLAFSVKLARNLKMQAALSKFQFSLHYLLSCFTKRHNFSVHFVAYLLARHSANYDILVTELKDV